MNELEAVSVVEVEDTDFSSYRWKLTDKEIRREVEANKKERRLCLCV